jgi:hypothetical protein
VVDFYADRGYPAATGAPPAAVGRARIDPADPTSPYDRWVNDYLRAVEQALAEVPASSRNELLSDMSHRMAVRQAELNPDAGLSGILRLDKEQAHRADAHPGPAASGPAASGPASGAHAGSATGAAADAAAAEPAESMDPLMEDEFPSLEDESIEVTPSRRLGALAWVLIVAAAMLVMCVAAALTVAFFLVRAASSH